MIYIHRIVASFKELVDKAREKQKKEAVEARYVDIAI